jgi:hypothetical protein
VNTNSPPETAREIRGLLDDLGSGDGGTRRRAVDRLARLGVWNRRGTRPRGTPWEAAAVALPHPDRLGELVAALGDPDPAVQSQAAAALGYWGDESVVDPIAAWLRAGTDETLRTYGLAALQTIGGPAAVAALAEAAGDPAPAVAQAAVEGLEALLTGGCTDDTSAPPFILQPPPERADEFNATVAHVRRVTERLAGAGAGPVQIKARDLLELLARRPEPRRVVPLTAAHLDALRSELDRTPATPAGDHLTDEEIVACALDEFAGLDRPRCEAHVASCADCAEAVEHVAGDLDAWLGYEGARRRADVTARVRRRLLEEQLGTFAVRLRTDLEQVLRIAARTAAHRVPTEMVEGRFLALRIATLGAAVTAELRGGLDDRTDDGTVRRRLLVETNGRLVVRLTSDDIGLAGVRVGIEAGPLHGECVLEPAVDRHQVRGEIAFAAEAWPALAAMPDVRIVLIEEDT